MRRGVLGDSNFIFPSMLYSATCDNTMIYLTESVKKIKEFRTLLDLIKMSLIRKRCFCLVFSCDTLTFILHDQYFQPL